MDDSTTDGDAPVIVTLRDVYNMVSKVATQMQGVPDRITDFERRIRSLERTMYIVIGVGVVAQFVVPVFLVQLFSH